MVVSGSTWGWAARAPCCASSGTPNGACAGVLIGGTNGKGSVQALVAAILGAAGMRVGQTPKPHLVELPRAASWSAGEPIAPDDFRESR